MNASSRRLTRPLLAAATLLALPTVHAGVMRDDIPVQTYRDYAENRGIFYAGATNVSVYKSDGVTLAGVIAQVPNFDMVNDGGYVTMFSATMGMSVDHVSYTTAPTFGARFNTTALPFSTFGDTYRQISASSPGYDCKIMRYSKIFIDAAPAPLMTDTAYIASMATAGRQITRVGGGTQAVATGWATQADAYPGGDNYGWLTGGFNTVYNVSTDNTLSATVNGVTSNYTGYTLNIRLDTTPDATLEIGTLGGDSGSPVFAWNSNTNRYELIAANSAGGGTGAGYGKASQLVTAPGYYTAVLAAYNSPTIVDTAGGGVILLGTPATVTDPVTGIRTGQGTLTQGAASWSYVGLASGTTGATATDAELNATKHLTFAGAGNEIRLTGSVDLGAAAITFDNGGTYRLTDGGVSTRRLNSAGYIINGATTLISEITGDAGDDWRKIGTGTLIIEGTGANAADLSLGEGLTVLNRTGGVAAHDVRLVSGRATVRLLGANQIGGDVIFGNRGGTLDLYGNHFSDASITHMDSGARITNTKAGNIANFTFTGTGAQTYLGVFTDGGSLAAGQLKVVYAGGAGNTWNLSGHVANTGGFDVGANGVVTLAAALTLHATGETIVPYSDPTDYVAASFNTGAGPVNLAAGSTLAFGRKTTATGDFAVADTATLKLAPAGGALRNTAQGLTDGTALAGTVALNGINARIIADTAAGFTATLNAAVSGSGKIQKDGAGVLVINGANTFSGGGLVNAGTVHAANTAALGAGSNNWILGNAGVLAITGADTATTLGKINASSTGTLALTGADTAPAALTGFNTLFVGAVNGASVAYGAAGTDITAINGGWRLGGGGGELRVDGRLSGTETLYIGNGYTTGVVTLANALNDFTGGITLGGGVELRYTDALALGGSNLTVGYGATATLGASPSTLMGKIAAASTGYVSVDHGATLSTALDFTGKNTLALGAAAGATATYAGTLTPGAAGYRFGGAGRLTVTATLTGANAVTVDGQNIAGGVITLSGNNDFTGAVTVRGYDSAITPAGTGTVTLKLGSDSALGANSGITLQNGGTLDADGHVLTTPSISGAGSILLTGGTSRLTVNGAASFSGVISGAGTLVKSGAGTLTLSGANTHTGGVTVTGGTLALGHAAALGTGTLTLDGATLANATASKLTLSTNNAQIWAGNLTLSGATSIDLGTGSVDLGSGARTVTVNSATGRTLTIGGVISGAGSIEKAGIGTLLLYGTDTYAGGTTISGGTLKLGNIKALGSGTLTLNYSSATSSTAPSQLDTALLTGSITLTNDIRLANLTGRMGINTVGGAADVITLSGVISGGGAGTIFRLNNNGVYRPGVKYILSGDNTYAGDTYLGEGGLRLDHANALGTSSLTFAQLAEDTMLTFGSSMTVANAITYSFLNKVVDTSTHTIELSGTQTFSKKVTKLGSGTLTLSGNNSGAGGFTVGAGKVVAGSSSAFGTGAVTVNTGGTLNTGLPGSNLTLANAITVNAGGRIMGAGTLNSALTLNGTIAPGNSPGPITLNAGGTFGATSVTEWEFVGNTLATGGVDFDQILVTGGLLTINTGATFKFVATGVDYTNALWDADRTFLVIDASGTGDSTGSFVLDTSLAGNFAAEGSWSLMRTGGDVLAKWTGGAIPEPSEYGLMGAGALAAISLIRRRRRKLAA